MSKTHVSAVTLAKWLGLSPRRLNQLVSQEVIGRADDGFDLEDSVRRYCDFLRKDEETKRERRELIRAQTAATRARAARHLGVAYTYADIRDRLRELEVKLWGLRVAAVWQQERLSRLLGEDAARIEYCTLHQQMSLTVSKLRDEMYALFPEPVAAEPESGEA